MRPRLLALAAALALGPGPAAAGAWPRAPGEVFLSLQGEMESGADGPDYDGSVYVEYGWTKRITLVGQFNSADDAWTPRRLGSGLRFALSRADATNQFAVGLGVSSPPDMMGMMTAVRGEAALHWGRGFSSRWGDGWATASARVIYGQDTKAPITDIFGLVGVRPRDGLMTMLSGNRYADDLGVYWKLTPAIGYELRREIWLVPSLTQEFSSDSATSVGLALWITF